MNFGNQVQVVERIQEQKMDPIKVVSEEWVQQRIVEQIVDVTVQRRITPRTLTFSPTCSAVTMRRRRLLRRETSKCYVKEFERAGWDDSFKWSLTGREA